MNRSIDIDSMTDSELERAYLDSKNKLFQATQQIHQLDSQISYLRKLFRRAEKNNGYAVRYNLRMQLSISSGVKVMYHHYAVMLEKRISNIRSKINLPESSSSSSQSSSTSDEAVDDSIEV
ncbi:hypothetical protein JTE90_017920 [Oedothorax gibbosus]|uniref:Uncharacterized protein n=1 Tax=Oedothorax gibbosus TaxID=931172 RepID=A0AAV6VJ30_9ARAC|nr:hypothetical protein JTE90_017920 [Oedothorax gibbosus]